MALPEACSPWSAARRGAEVAPGADQTGEAVEQRQVRGVGGEPFLKQVEPAIAVSGVVAGARVGPGEIGVGQAARVTVVDPQRGGVPEHGDGGGEVFEPDQRLGTEQARVVVVGIGLGPPAEGPQRVCSARPRARSSLPRAWSNPASTRSRSGRSTAAFSR